MTQEKRENWIMFISWIIFIIAILLSKRFLWPCLIFVIFPYVLTRVLNKCKPLKKGPRIAWWKELLLSLSVYVVTSMVMNFVNKQPVFSSQTLILTIIFILAFSLGSWSQKNNK